MTSFYFFLIIIESISSFKNNNEAFYPRLWRLAYILFEIVFTFEFVITLIFWGIVYPFSDFRPIGFDTILNY